MVTTGQTMQFSHLFVVRHVFLDISQVAAQLTMNLVIGCVVAEYEVRWIVRDHHSGIVVDGFYCGGSEELGHVQRER
jgi:hypothetical protein